MLATVTPGGPADKGGLQPGDIIIEFNGRPVADSEALVNMVVATKPGTTVPRHGLPQEAEEGDEHRRRRARSRRRAGSPGERGREPCPVEEPTATGFGMEVGPITPEVARELELPRNRGGAVVLDVERNSPAFNAGIRPNDVIVEVNQQEVSNVSQVQRELQRAAPGQPVFLLIWRDGESNFVTLRKR